MGDDIKRAAGFLERTSEGFGSRLGGQVVCVSGAGKSDTLDTARHPAGPRRSVVKRGFHPNWKFTSHKLLTRLRSRWMSKLQIAGHPVHHKRANCVIVKTYTSIFPACFQSMFFPICVSNLKTHIFYTHKCCQVRRDPATRVL